MYPVTTAHLCINCGKNIVAPNKTIYSLVTRGKQLSCPKCVKKNMKRPTYKDMSYSRYLTTAHWRKLSRSIRNRDGGKCRVCNDGGLTDVHHRTYENLGNEQPTDLITLCRQCHQLFETHKLVTTPATVKVLVGLV